MKNKLFVISRYKESFDWITKYTDNYIIYNKGEPITGYNNIVNVENIGQNQRDICYFISTHYDNLPSTMVFIQANPFDHCKKEIFDVLIKNNKFTPLEYHGTTPANNYENRDTDGGFMEINNSWYISAHNASNSQTCRYNSFDEFMNKYFENYSPLIWIKFAPGSQYIIKKQQALQYPKFFWDCLMNELNTLTPTEGHIIERSFYYIFTGTYKLRKDFYDK